MQGYIFQLYLLTCWDMGRQLGEEDDKLVSMTALCEFQFSPKPLFSMRHIWLNLRRGMSSRHCNRFFFSLPSWLNFNILWYTCHVYATGMDRNWVLERNIHCRNKHALELPSLLVKTGILNRTAILRQLQLLLSSQSGPNILRGKRRKVTKGKA